MVTTGLATWTTILVGAGGVAVGFVLASLAPRAIGLLRYRAMRRHRVARPRDELFIAEPELGERDDIRATLENIAGDPIRGPRFYVSDIAVTAFRCFETSTIDLRHPGEPSRLDLRNVNLILGDNGSGKSTLLKAIALGALGPVLDSSGFVPYHLVRNGYAKASIAARFVDDAPDRRPRPLKGRLEIERVRDYERISEAHDAEYWASLFNETDPTFLVVGYGVNRRTAEDESDFPALEKSRRRRRYQRVAGLFDESAVLTPLSSWLPSASRGRRAETMELLETLLPSDTTLAPGGEREAVFRHRGVEVPYRALSDGYKSFIGWVGDLLFQIDSVTEGQLPYTQVGGIVLVDEVDLLLHPVWQRDVVPNIARALPNLQFVFTSHSPIVAGTLQAENIVIARETDDGASHLDRLKASIHGLDAEQILLSSYFELESTRAPDAQARLHALARQAMEGDDEAAVEYLRALTDAPTDDA